MRRHLFLRIMEALDNYSEYFPLRYDATKNRGLMPLTKCTIAMRMLAYGIVADCIDEYLMNGCKHSTRMHEEVHLRCHQVFGEEYLRKSKQADVDCQLQVAKARDFFSILGSIDCVHW